MMDPNVTYFVTYLSHLSAQRVDGGRGLRLGLKLDKGKAAGAVQADVPGDVDVLDLAILGKGILKGHLAAGIEEEASRWPEGFGFVKGAKKTAKERKSKKV